jgi:S-adenosyl methyltransferase
MTHARALLAGPGVGAAQGDLGDPAAILADPDVLKLIHPGEPTAVILAMVLHFFDAGTAGKITAAFTGWLLPGSYLMISVGSGDERTGGELAREYTAATLYNHTPGQVSGFFAGLELVSPGLADARDWDPARPAAPPRQRAGRILAGVGRKQQEPPRVGSGDGAGPFTAVE